MSHAIPYREDTRTTAAFVLSALLHGLAAGLLAAFFMAHPAPKPVTSHVLELMAGPPAPLSQNENSGGGAKSAVPDFTNLTSLTAPQPTPPTPVQQRPQDVAPTPTQQPRVTTPPPRPTPRSPTPRANPPSATIIPYSEFLKTHPKSVPAPTRGSARPAPHVSVDPDKYAQNLEKVGNGTGAGQRTGRSTNANSGGAGGTSDDYDARLRQRVYDAFIVPPGSAGLSAGIHLVIAPDGSVIEKHLTQSSGNEMFDAAVRQALLRLTNVDPPPDGQQTMRDFTLIPRT